MQKLKVHQSEILKLAQFFPKPVYSTAYAVDFLIFRNMSEFFKDSTYISFLRFSHKFLDHLLICLNSIISSDSHNVKQLRVIVFEKCYEKRLFTLSLFWPSNDEKLYKSGFHGTSRQTKQWQFSVKGGLGVVPNSFCTHQWLPGYWFSWLSWLQGCWFSSLL